MTFQKDYWKMTDAELQRLAEECNISPWRLAPARSARETDHFVIDRERIIKTLAERDSALMAQTLMRPVEGQANTGKDTATDTGRQTDEAKPSSAAATDPATVAVVYGRNEKAREAMFDFLRALGLKPLEFAKAISLAGEGSPYVANILDALFRNAQAVIVLLTGDEEVRLREQFRDLARPEDAEADFQSRPNVLFEAGLSMGSRPKQTIFVQIGEHRKFSDMGGRHVLHFCGKPEDRNSLASRLESAGCIVDKGGTDWLKRGDFEAAALAARGDPAKGDSTIAEAARRDKRRIQKELNYLTPKERAIIAYLLAKKQKVFEVLPDGEEAATLIAKGFVVVAKRRPPAVHRDIIVEVPEHVWEVLLKNRAKFPYEGREPERAPWRTPWMAR